MNENLCAMPSVDERIERLRADVNALYRLIPEELERLQEKERQGRWHATYNAALASYSLYDLGVEQAHSLCTAYADRAHGPLEPKA